MFESVFGHARQKAQLERQLADGTLSHAYLFTGPEGCGKFALAEALARAYLQGGLAVPGKTIGDSHPDLIIAGRGRAADMKIEEVRALTAQTDVRPLEGSRRAFVIDHAGRATLQAQNALLKTLEEPQPGNLFILVSETAGALLPTIQSRCQHLVFHDLSETEKRAFFAARGLSAPRDLSQTPGKLLERVQAPAHAEKLDALWAGFEKVFSGDALEAFVLAQKIADGGRAFSEEAAGDFLRRLHHLRPGTEPGRVHAVSALFELLGKLQYNINLRLQWEACLIAIASNSNKTRSAGGDR